MDFDSAEKKKEQFTEQLSEEVKLNQIDLKDYMKVKEDLAQ
jgi:hypothetical protein